MIVNAPYSRIQNIKPLVIPVIKELTDNNPGTISLGQGVVSYAPPDKAISAIQDFLSNPQHHKYQQITGISELKQMIQRKILQDNKVAINDGNCIVVTAGSNMGFLNAILAITDSGDEIILNVPYYFNHEMAIRIANCQPVLVDTDENYQPKIDALSQAITSKTKAIVTVSPNNPTGVVYPELTLRKINQICQKAGIYHISDEAYEYFTYSQADHASPASFTKSTSHTISLFSLSKSYGFASWRVGYMVIPSLLLSSIVKIQDTNLICPPVISQYAALGALQSDKSYLRNHLSEIKKVREIVFRQLQTLPKNCSVSSSDGAFYFFIKVYTDMSDFELSKKLIEQYKVAVIPGSAFGIKHGCSLRISYGTLTLENALLAITRLIKGIRELTA